MRIAIVSDYFLDYVGGAQSSMLEQRAAFEEAGHAVFVVSAATATRGRVEGLDLAIKPAATIPGLLLPVIFNRPRLVKQLAEFFYAEGIQVVHAQTDFGLAHAAAIAARELGIPIVHTVHTFYWASSGIAPTLATPIMKALLRGATRARLGSGRLDARPSDSVLKNVTLAMATAADVVVSPSAHQAADLVAAGLSVPVELVPNPIARASRAAVPLDADSVAFPRILWVARCEPEKRPVVFAKAVVDALKRTNNGFAVDFVGDGSELAAVRTVVEGESSFVIHGALDHDRVLDLMDASALVALTSYGFDNQPMTIAEAVSRFRGVLFCDPKLREGLGDSGFLSATPDERGLADAIVQLVSEPARLLALSEGAQRDARVFASDTFVDRMLEVYEVARARIAA